MWSQLVVDLAIAAVVAWAWGRRAGHRLPRARPSLSLVYPFIYLRLDLLSVFLAVLGIALVRRRHHYAGGATLAVACFAKVWPVVLVPVLIVRRAWRALAAFVAVGVAGTAAWIAWGGIDGPVQVLTFRGAKGWEFESTVGALVRSVSGVTPHIERGAWRVGEVTSLVSGLLVLALLAGLAAAWVLASRAKPRRHGRARRAGADGRDHRVPRALAAALAAVPGVALAVRGDRRRPRRTPRDASRVRRLRSECRVARPVAGADSRRDVRALRPRDPQCSTRRVAGGAGAAADPVDGLATARLRQLAPATELAA